MFSLAGVQQAFQVPQGVPLMFRLEAVAAWLFTCLGITLLGISVMVVPAKAFADAGSDCQTKCGSDTTCLGNCCFGSCGTDYTCTYNCCQSACSNDSKCIEACGNQANCANCSLGNSYCFGGDKAMCESNPPITRLCWCKLSDCWCVWSGTKCFCSA